MIAISRLVSVALLGAAIPMVAALAQTNKSGSAAGSSGAGLAVPTYPPGHAPDPALSPGTLPKGKRGVPAADDPNVPGATGRTIVRGDHSTIGSDRRGTAEQKAGAVEAGGN
jgi:hypothetical protein